MNFKKWNKIFIFETIVVLVLILVLVIVIDPFFHFHKPISNLHYSLKSGYER